MSRFKTNYNRYSKRQVHKCLEILYNFRKISIRFYIFPSILQIR